MGTNYTGNPAGVEAPDTGPVANGAPTGVLPADGDPPNAATWAQPFKVLLDWVAFNAKRMSASPWGTGTDGDATITGTTTLSNDVNYNNLTIGATGILVAQSFVINVKGTLTVVSGGKIIDLPAATKRGGDGTGGSRGSAGIGTNNSASGTYLGGANGAPGGTTATVGSPGDSVSFSLGGQGGAGSAANGGIAGGAAGGFSPPTSGTLTDLGRAFSQPGWVIQRTGTISARTGTLRGYMGGGSGGSGGGTVSASQGAGSGAGGGLVIVFAQHAALATSSDIMAPGGAGGSCATGAFPGGGAGGGGGGGAVLLYYGAKSGPALVASAAVPGGAAGTGEVAASAGTAGQVFEFNVGY